MMLRGKRIGKLWVSVTLGLSFTIPASAVVPAQIASANSVESMKAITKVNDKAEAILKTGEKYLRVPYKFGSKPGNTRTFDCSSFTQHVYGQHGIKLKRKGRVQAEAGDKVRKENMQKGDLLYFKSPDHVGIYAGDGWFLHTIPKGGVQYTRLSGNWVHRLDEVRRLIKPVY